MLIALIAAAAVQAAPSPEAEAGAVIDRMHQAAAVADEAAYFATFTPDARFIGTDATERWTLPEFREWSRPYFARGRAWTFTPTERTVTLAPVDCRCIAWFDEVLDNAGYGVTRGSGVLRLTDDGWRIEQYVLSFTVPNDRADAVTAVIRAPAAD